MWRQEQVLLKQSRMHSALVNAKLFGWARYEILPRSEPSYGRFSAGSLAPVVCSSWRTRRWHEFSTFSA